MTEYNVYYCEIVYSNLLDTVNVAVQATDGEICTAVPTQTHATSEVLTILSSTVFLYGVS